MRILWAQALQLFLIDVEPLKEALAIVSTLATNAPNAQAKNGDRLTRVRLKVEEFQLLIRKRDSGLVCLSLKGL